MELRLYLRLCYRGRNSQRLPASTQIGTLFNEDKRQQRDDASQWSGIIALIGLAYVPLTVVQQVRPYQMAWANPWLTVVRLFVSCGNAVLLPFALMPHDIAALVKMLVSVCGQYAYY